MNETLPSIRLHQNLAIFRQFFLELLLVSCNVPAKCSRHHKKFINVNQVLQDLAETIFSGGRLCCLWLVIFSVILGCVGVPQTAAVHNGRNGVGRA